MWSERFEKCEVETRVSEETGKSRNFYYHKGECWKKRLFTIQDEKEKDEMNEVIKKIFNIKKQIPDNIWWMLQDLRNGTNRYKLFWKRKFKAGYPYPVIAEAYKMSKDNIEWARLNRPFKTLEEEMKYSLKIISRKLEDAYKKIERTERQEEFSKAKEEAQMPDMIEEMLDNREVKLVKRKEEQDLSDLFGDS